MVNRRIFFIIGMHRTGTSFLAHALSMMGLELPSSIQPGAVDNPKGHFESSNIALFHDKLLKKHGLSWDTSISLPTSWFSSEYAKNSIQALTDKLHSEFPGNEPIVLKDPRLCLFLPIWKNICEKSDLLDFYIIPIRHPLEVAASLNKRNKIGQARSCLIWLNYYFNAEKHTRERKRSFIHFPIWTHRFKHTIDKIEDDLDTAFPKKNKQNLLKAKNEFEQSLVHHINKDTVIAQNYIEKLCFRTFNAFLKLTIDPYDAKTLIKIDGLRNKYDELSAVYAEIYSELEIKKEAEIEEHLDASERKREQAVARADTLEKQFSETEERAAEMAGQLEMSRSEVEQAVARADTLEKQFGETEGLAAEMAEQFEMSRSEVKEAVARANIIEKQRCETERRAAILEKKLAVSQNQCEQVYVRAVLRADTLQAQLNELVGLSEKLEKELEASQSDGEQSTAKTKVLLAQLDETEGRATELEKQLKANRSEGEQATEHANTLQQQLTETEGRAAEWEQLLQAEKKSTSALQKEINELKIQHRSLAKEHEQLLASHNKEQFTVVRPIYKNIYRKSGLLLRNFLPATWVESIKKITPNPNGIPKRLTYQPQVSKHIAVLADQFQPPTSESSPDIFILSIINWDFRYQRPQHIAKGLADIGRRVFYVEMELADDKLQVTKISNNLYRARLSGQNVGHIQPYTGQPDPGQTVKWITAFYDLCNAVRATSFKQIIIHHPYWWQLARHLPPEFQMIFDCMDDISGFSNTEQFLLDLEQDLLSKGDKLIVSSQYLFNKYKHFQLPVLIRNAAELTHFSKKTKVSLAPSFLQQHASEKGPSNTIKVGYVGAIAEWFDVELVKDVALNESRYEFHLCGAVTAKEPLQLEEIDNVFLHGEIPYSDVPGFLHEMDVLIIPFKIIPIIQACDPVKFYEYSAMGKPTVTTALPELSRVSNLTFFASTSSEFAEKIREAYKKGMTRNFRKQLQDYAAQNTWKHRTAQFVEILSNAPKVSVVILSYDDPELTKTALHSLYDNGPTYPNLEVLIVDNGSPSDALEVIKKFATNLPSATIIENGENLGFAKGNNVGLEAASGDYVMLLNNDTVVAPGAIYAMVRHLEHTPAIGAVGPLTNNIGNEAKLFVEYEEMEQMKDIARQATTGYRGVTTPINVSAYFAVMFRRADLKTFGLLSEDYGRGMFEDDDHCAMINSKGYTCALAEDAYVHHHLSATFSKLKDGEKEALFESNKMKYEKKWGPWRPHKYREERPLRSMDSKG